MEPIYPLGALTGGGEEVLRAAETSLVRLTVDGYGRYVFATEGALEEYVQRRVDDAVYEQELIEVIQRGMEDAEAGRLIPAEQAWEELRRLRAKNACAVEASPSDAE